MIIISANTNYTNCSNNQTDSEYGGLID